MTHPHPGAPRDVDLAAWLNAAGFHPADTTLKQLGHQAARTIIGELGTILWQILPPSREKSLVFTALEQARWAANQALAVHGGPGEHVTEDNLRDLIASLAVDMPTDPRIREYEAQQRGEELGHAVVSADAQVVRDGGFVIPDSRKDALALLELYTEAVRARHPEAPESGHAIVSADDPAKVVGYAHTGYVSPFQAPGHDGEHHALRLTRDRDEHADQAARVAEAIRTTLRGDYEIRAEDYRAAAYAAMGAHHGTTGSWWTLADATPQDEAVSLLDGFNEEVNRRWPGAGWTISDAGEQGDPAQPIVTPPAEEHGIPDSAVEDGAAYVLWGLEDTTHDTDGVALGVGLEPGRVTLHLSNGSTRLAVPFFSQSTVNRAIEAQAAAAARAFK
jgi:hypothetical protein